MGKYVDGIHGAFKGKVGNIIGSSWRGIPYMKSRPMRTKPPTEREKQNRYIFGMTQEWLSPLTNFLRIGFKNYTHTNQGVNAAKSYLHKHALTRNGYDSIIDPTLMKVSHGNLPFPDRMEVELNSEDELVFTWEPGKLGVDYAFDQILLLAYDIENGNTEMSLNGQFRTTGKDVLEIDKLQNFVVYAAFVSSDRTRQSDSVYLGSFTKIANEETPEEEAGSKKEVASDNKTTVDSGNTKTTAPDNITTSTSENIAAVASDNTTKDENKLPGIAGGEAIAVSGDAAETEYVPENQLSLFNFSDKKIEEKAEIENGDNDSVSETNVHAVHTGNDPINSSTAEDPTDPDQSSMSTEIKNADIIKETTSETHTIKDQDVENNNEPHKSALINESETSEVLELTEASGPKLVSNLTDDFVLTKVSKPTQISLLADDSVLTEVSEPKLVSSLEDGIALSDGTALIDDAVLKDETVLTDIPPLGNSELPETETEKSVNQKFIYIKPNEMVKDEKSGLSIKLDPEADEKVKEVAKRVKLKRNRITVFTTEDKVEEMKRNGYEDA